jgi:predicted NBD/HSP70 family sugar kinase
LAVVGSRELIRDINEKTILKEIFLEKQIDRASLARKTSLSGGTVTKITSDLLKKGLIRVVGESTSTGGRKPVLLSINPNFGNILGVKIGLGYLQLIITDLSGKILSQQRKEFGEELDPHKISYLIKEYVEQKNKNHLIGASVAVSGTIDSIKGVVLDSFILNWKNVELGKILKNILKVPIYIINDADSFTLAHLWKGKLKKHKHALVMILGVGIGGSLIVNGNLYTGSGGAGEIGHMTIKENGNKCSCGSYGCLEAEASFESLVNKIYTKSENILLKEYHKTFKNTELSEIDFIRLALKEDPQVSQEVFKEYSTLIGIAIKNLINIFTPEYFLIGGEALEFSDYFLDNSINYAKENAFGNLGERVIYDVDNLGPKAWMLGGIYQVIQEEMFYIKV